MPFYNAANLDAANETTVPLDTAGLFSGAGRYPPQNLARWFTARPAPPISMSESRPAPTITARLVWAELAAITAHGTPAELTYFPEMQYRLRVATRGAGNTLRCALFSVGGA